MEESPGRPSVAKLAGKFKGHLFPTPTGIGEKSMIASPHPPMARSRNSALVERLQANLALSPGPLQPTASRSPELKLQPKPLSLSAPCTPLCAPQHPPQSPPHTHGEEEPPVGFEKPVEGTVLPSINKGRARLSVKRRLPTRQHRKSYHEEQSVAGAGTNSPPLERCGTEGQAPGEAEREVGLLGAEVTGTQPDSLTRRQDEAEEAAVGKEEAGQPGGDNTGETLALAQTQESPMETKPHPDGTATDDVQQNKLKSPRK